MCFRRVWGNQDFQAFGFKFLKTKFFRPLFRNFSRKFFNVQIFFALKACKDWLNYLRFSLVLPPHTAVGRLLSQVAGFGGYSEAVWKMLNSVSTAFKKDASSSSSAAAANAAEHNEIRACLMGITKEQEQDNTQQQQQRYTNLHIGEVMLQLVKPTAAATTAVDQSVSNNTVEAESRSQVRFSSFSKFFMPFLRLLCHFLPKFWRVSKFAQTIHPRHSLPIQATRHCITLEGRIINSVLLYRKYKIKLFLPNWKIQKNFFFSLLDLSLLFHSPLLNRHNLSLQLVQLLLQLHEQPLPILLINIHNHSLPYQIWLNWTETGRHQRKSWMWTKIHRLNKIISSIYFEIFKWEILNFFFSKINIKWIIYTIFIFFNLINGNFALILSLYTYNSAHFFCFRSFAPSPFFASDCRELQIEYWTALSYPCSSTANPAALPNHGHFQQPQQQQRDEGMSPNVGSKFSMKASVRTLSIGWWFLEFWWI